MSVTNHQKNKYLAQLREHFDSDDLFIAGGHAVRGGARTNHTRRTDGTPEWATNDESVRKILLTVFPKLATNENQRERAGIWMTAIHMYFRLGYTRLHVAMVNKWSFSKVNSLVRSIQRVAAGNQSYNNKPRGVRPRGRPRKQPELIDALF